MGIKSFKQLCICIYVWNHYVSHFDVAAVKGRRFVLKHIMDNADWVSSNKAKHSSFVNQRQELVAEDDTIASHSLMVPYKLPIHRPAAHTTKLPLLKLTDFFNFTSNTHWAAAVRSVQKDSFEKEVQRTGVLTFTSFWIWTQKGRMI